ncbi:MAG: OmpA family protein [Bauldia sp.]|nr:OmpA family protein [Bauldia sp.]
MIFRNDGTRIVTTTDPYGNIAERIRIDPDGTETILIQSASNIVIGQPLPPPPPPPDFNVILPPIQINIAQELYIVEADRASQNDIVAALIAQPVEVVERPYTLEEIRYSDRIRDKVRRIDLTTITFDTGSAAINPDQFDELIEIGQALQEILGMFPNAVFLVEGHADAVGSEYSNLLLSDRRAETVAVALSTNFGIPPENLITQGYGEAFLKIPTLAAERQNRRVALRNITELLFADTPVVEPPRG